MEGGTAFSLSVFSFPLGTTPFSLPGPSEQQPRNKFNLAPVKAFVSQVLALTVKSITFLFEGQTLGRKNRSQARLVSRVIRKIVPQESQISLSSRGISAVHALAGLQGKQWRSLSSLPWSITMMHLSAEPLWRNVSGEEILMYFSMR